MIPRKLPSQPSSDTLSATRKLQDLRILQQALISDCPTPEDRHVLQSVQEEIAGLRNILKRPDDGIVCIITPTPQPKAHRHARG